jgi:hypothetical protein
MAIVESIAPDPTDTLFTPLFFLSLLTRPFRLIGLLITVGLVVGGWWAWNEIHSSTSASEAQALEDFRTRDQAAAGARRPRPGVYAYRVTGSETASAGPLEVKRDLPSRAQMIVRRTSAGYETELRLSEEHVETFAYRVESSGTRITSSNVKLMFLKIGRDDRRTLQPAPLYVPANLSVGRSWRAAYKAGTLAVVVANKVVRTENVTVAGRALRTFVITSRSDTTGAHSGKRVETMWWSPELVLPVRQTVDMDIGGIVGLKAKARLDLQSFLPRT